MKRNNIIAGLLLLLGFLAQGSMAATPSHWTCDINAYQYDMSVYFSLSMDGNAITDYSDYEVAAFCNGVCRGVADIFEQETNDGMKTICYLRVRSNKPSAENISFKVYKRSTNKVFFVPETVSFVSEKQEGSPSSPITLTVMDKILGDVNGNGQVDIGDAVSIQNYLVGKDTATFVEIVADTNHNGQIDIGDAVTILNYLVGKIPEL